MTAATGAEPASIANLETERLPVGTVALFSAPALGQGFMFLLTNMYLLKFSTDVLGIAPAVMGFVFLLSRIWDAMSDPLAGYLSDNTRTRIGRRRPWLIAGAIPVGLVFYLMWAPPESLSPDALVYWMGAAVILFYTGMTIFNVPHDSLAAELTESYEDRNRIFGVRRAFFGVGTLLVFAAIAWLSASETPRADARVFAGVGAVVTAVCMLVTGIRIRERPDYQGRGGENPFRAFSQVVRNPHARVLLFVFFVQQIGVGAITFMAAYYAQYIIGDGRALAPIIGSLFATSIVSIPVWVALGHHFEKKPLLMIAMFIVGGALFSMGFLGEGDLTPVVIVSGIAGIAVGGLDVLFPSIQADVIDYDELQTDERKEGVYFAAWHFAEKTAIGISGLLAGLALSATGYVAGGEQPGNVAFAMRALMSGVPLLTYGTGIWMFRRFALTREVHTDMRRELDARAVARASLKRRMDPPAGEGFLPPTAAASATRVPEG